MPRHQNETPVEREERLARRRERRKLRREAETPQQRADRLARRRRGGERVRPNPPNGPRIVETYSDGMALVATPRATHPFFTPRPIPTHIRTEMVEMADALGRKWSCPICLDEKAPSEFHISPCGHKFCSEHLSDLQSSRCPECRESLMG